MPSSIFFARLGLFVVNDFFDTSLCATLCSEISSSVHIPSTIVDDEIFAEKVDEDVRKTNRAQVSSSILCLTRKRLLSLKPRLENHFNLVLAGCETPQYLMYTEGDFFYAHQDKSDNPNKPDYVKRRQLSVVIFLNSQTRTPKLGSFCGGELILFGLIRKPGWKKYGFSLEGEEGLMIAFPSDIFHEVSLVTSGERYSIVSWFF